MTEHSADYVRVLREAATRPCAAGAMMRQGWGRNCMHCHAVRKLRLIDGGDHDGR